MKIIRQSSHTPTAAQSDTAFTAPMPASGRTEGAIASNYLSSIQYATLRALEGLRAAIKIQEVCHA